MKDAQVRTASLEENNDDDADNKVGWRRTIPWSDSFATMKKAKQFDNGNVLTWQILNVYCVMMLMSI